MFTFGSAPNWFAQEQNILLFVRSCACTSRPMTVSYFSRFESSAIGLFRPFPRRQREAAAHALVRVSYLENSRFIEMAPNELKTDRKLFAVEATGNGDSRKARQIHRQGENIGKIHRQRVIRFFPE